MHESYEDIRAKIPESPQWFDENAVPRYCNFEPRRCANIYADEAALAEITCQGCGQRFCVAFSQDRMTEFKRGGKSLADDIRAKELHYGDPPNIGCCAAGPTMNSEPRRVLEYWHRNNPEYVRDGIVTNVVSYMEWRRDSSLEVDIRPDWVE